MCRRRWPSTSGRPPRTSKPVRRPRIRSTARRTARGTSSSIRSSRTGRHRPRSVRTVGPASTASRTRTGHRHGTRSRAADPSGSGRAARARPLRLSLMTEPTAAPSLRRRMATVLSRRPKVRLGLELSLPATWLLVVYAGSLAALIVTSLYTLADDPTGLLTRLDTTLGLQNFRRLWEEPVYREITIRTITAAVTVTVIDLVLALPVAFYMAKV